MGTAESTNQVGTVLFGKTQRAVLALLLGHPQESFYLRQIVRTLGIGQGTVQRELARLADAGVLVRSRQGNQVYYRANTASPVFSELKSLIMKTAGVVDVLRDALNTLADRIAVAFVHGSLARGTEGAESDVDLMVVGDVTFTEVLAAVRTAQGTIDREVNPTVYPVREFRRKLKSRHHFLKSVMENPKLFLVGGERELKRLGAERLVDRA